MFFIPVSMNAVASRVSLCSLYIPALHPWAPAHGGHIGVGLISTNISSQSVIMETQAVFYFLSLLYIRLHQAAPGLGEPIPDHCAGSPALV